MRLDVQGVNPQVGVESLLGLILEPIDRTQRQKLLRIVEDQRRY
jgi:hypothetical protein